MRAMHTKHYIEFNAPHPVPPIRRSSVKICTRRDVTTVRARATDRSMAPAAAAAAVAARWGHAMRNLKRACDACAYIFIPHLAITIGSAVSCGSAALVAITRVKDASTTTTAV